MTRPCAYLWNLCGALIVLSSAALAQDATGPQPVAIDFTFPIDASPPVGSAYIGIAASSANDPGDVLQINPGQRPTVELYDRESRHLRFMADVKRVDVFDPDIVEFDIVSGRELQVTGRRQGTTRMRVTTDPDQTVVVEVIVTRNVSEFTLLLKRLYPEASIEVFPVRDSLIVRGTVADTEHMEQIRDIASEFAPRVFIQLKVEGTVATGAIPDGYRVISVPIGESQSVAGTLRAGDRVDVLVTFQRREGTGMMQARTVTLLENVEVFAPDSRADDRSRMTLVSLLVRPEEVNAIILAQSRGNLSLAWRQPQKEASAQLNVSALQELEGPTESRPVPNSSTVGRSGEDAEVQLAGDLLQIRNELRALHDDVRRLIEILEQRNKEKPGATTQGAPAPAAAAPARDNLVGLFFMADWCGPCRQMAPVVARMKEQHSCAIRTIDIEAERELAQIFAIHSIPAIVVLDDGHEVDRIVGLTTEDRLKQAFSRTVDSAPSRASSSTYDRAWELLGLRLVPASADRLGVGSHYRGGLEVAAVRPNSPADRKSIRAGDFLVGLHVWETVSTENVDFVLQHNELTAFLPLKFYLVRNGETMFGNLELDKLAVPIDPESFLKRAAQRLEPAAIDPEAVKRLPQAI